ncbi:MAG: murein L,D-transpeptidase, partial [Bacteroidales bacterium]|nr:murein L,D-transpeptidase [Bacteroidales bacterium]
PLPSPPSKPPTTPSTHQPVKPSTPSGFERTFALQLHLDQANYSPGGLDGHWGAKSRHALTAWQLAHHLPPTGDPTDPTRPAALTATNNLFATHTVTPADHAALTAPASGWREKSKRDRLGCTTLSELLSERYHLYEATLRHLNPDAPFWPNPPPGTILTVPAGIPSPTSQKTRLPPLSRLEIRLADHTLRAYAKDGTLAAQFPCSIAADKAKRPVDRTLHVRVWAENPEYTFDPALYADDPAAATIGKRLRIPPGPNNPVGVAWIGLDLPDYGIHGTPAPEDITKTESHGCFRLTNWDALRLVHAVHKDLPVKILP